jgi:hypothetical protein
MHLDPRKLSRMHVEMGFPWNMWVEVLSAEATNGSSFYIQAFRVSVAGLLIGTTEFMSEDHKNF